VAIAPKSTAQTKKPTSTAQPKPKAARPKVSAAKTGAAKKAPPAALTAPPPPPPPVAKPKAQVKAAPAKPKAAKPVAAKPKPAPAAPPKITKAKPTPAPKQTAAVSPPSVGLQPGHALRIEFSRGSADLPGAKKDDLAALAGRLSRNERLRLQLLAYASGTKETASQARRLSLSRALAVRSYLIEKGLRSTRIDVRALGNKAPDNPADRVDLVAIER
jgi:outer membrane protein OmpA-like peptidoglycan-associated protein